jgi:hypothetical protein
MFITGHRGGDRVVGRRRRHRRGCRPHAVDEEIRINVRLDCEGVNEISPEIGGGATGTC